MLVAAARRAIGARLFGGGGKLTWNRFTGPGGLAIQTLFIAPLEGIGSNAQAPVPAASRAR